MMENIIFKDKASYPPVCVNGPQAEYAAAMVDNMGACNSEMSAVSLYFYNSIITKEAFEEISRCFHGISVVEMHHLEIFGELSFLLGADPRLWHCRNGKMTYWSPECNRYPDKILQLLDNAIQGELDAIEKYKAQMQWIRDCNITANLQRIIMDEELHIEIFQDLYYKVSGRKSSIFLER